ncbi:hypothetical protein LBMAG27_13680 [Bacteroidota bacterium]|nr:hypothetical protein LBMAG27_13680 [Bacteroidota bacterium]
MKENKWRKEEENIFFSLMNRMNYKDFILSIESVLEKPLNELDIENAATKFFF